MNEPNEFANIFNYHFVNIGESNSDSHLSFSDYKPVTVTEMFNIVNKIPCGNSLGYDNICTCLLKSVINFLLVRLTHICNLLFQNGDFSFKYGNRQSISLV